MNTLVRVRGYVTSAHIFEPLRRFIDTEPKYTLSIQPENPYTYDVLESSIQALREANIHTMMNSRNSDGSYWEEHYESRVINGSEIQVESLYKPDIQMEINSDDDLYGKFIQLVGHLYIHQTGIICLSSHIIETAYHPNENFEPCIN